jgi:hypothetical protein
MFVLINNTDMDINDIERWIKTARDANCGEISPESAMEVLSKTNHLGHIKKVLRNIKDKCITPEEIAPYKEFILSCVDGREMSGEALKMLQSMADLCDCRKNLDDINKEKEKIYNKYDFEKVVVVKSIEEFKSLKGENLKVYFSLNRDRSITFNSCDFAKVKSFRFNDNTMVEFEKCYNFPKVVELSGCSKVFFLSNDLMGVDEIKLGNGVSFYSSKDKNLPEILDLSSCSDIYIGKSNLSSVKQLKLGKNSAVCLDEVYNIPEDLDCSQCDKVSFCYCNLNEIKDINLKENCVFKLCGVKNVPKDLDVSKCSNVLFEFCSLDHVENLKFKEGTDVVFKSVKLLPKNLDVSMCSQIGFAWCDFKGVKSIKFKNKAKKNAMYKCDNFRDELIYAEDDEVVNTFSVNGGAEM